MGCCLSGESVVSPAAKHAFFEFKRETDKLFVWSTFSAASSTVYTVLIVAACDPTDSSLGASSDNNLFVPIRKLPENLNHAERNHYSAVGTVW